MQEIEPGWEQVLRIGWLLVWRGLVGIVVISFVLGLVINLVLGLGFGMVLGQTANLLTGVAVTLIWSPLVLRMALRKKYQGFRIALVARD